MNESRRHWKKTAEEWQQHPQLLWREHSDAVSLQLISKWRPDHAVESVLKTGLFAGLYSPKEILGCVRHAIIDIPEGVCQ